MKLLLLLAITLTLHVSSLAESWPRFRGPNGEGISDAVAIPSHWTTEDYRWRVRLPGVGYSSPVISGDRLFVTSAIEEDATQIIRCLRTSDGGLVWEREFPSDTHSKHQFNCYGSSTPVLDQQCLYVMWATPERYTLLALDQEKGTEQWRRDLGLFVSQHGFGASPIVFEDMVILPNEQDGPSSVIAVDRRTGQTRWISKRRTVKAAFSTPCIYRPKEGPPQLIVTSQAHGISSLDPYTGELHWELPEFKHRVVGSPAIVGDLIAATCGSGGVGRQALVVKPSDPTTGSPAEVAYEVTGSLPYVPTPVSNGNLLFLWYDRGVVTCLDGPSGRIHWRERVGGDYFGSPIRVGDRLYCISREGEMVVVSATKEFELLGRIDLEEPSNSTPAVADGVMYLRTASHLMAIGGTETVAVTQSASQPAAP